MSDLIYSGGKFKSDQSIEGVPKIDKGVLIVPTPSNPNPSANLPALGKRLYKNEYSLTIGRLKSENPGLITILRGSTKIGTIEQDTSKIVLNKSASEDEKEYFAITKIVKSVKNQAELVIAKDPAISEMGPIEQGSKIKEIMTGSAPSVEVQTEISRESSQNLLNLSDANIGQLPQVNINGESRSDYGNYVYPEDMKTNQQDRIIFKMKRIEKTEVDPFFYKNNKQFKRILSNTLGSVSLPIQPTISDRNDVDFSGLQLNAIDAALAGSAYSLAKNGSIEELFNTAGGMANSVKTLVAGEGNGDIAEGFRVFLAQQAAGVQGLLSRTSGAVLNPNLELLFRGPQLRPFSFVFTLSPRNKLEGASIRNIIRFFKQGMSVKTTSSNVFLKSPDVFEINYKTFDSEGVIGDHKSINRIKTCALISCGVEYTPDGSYMTFNDPERTMTSYKINLQFTELDPIYDKDYNAFDKENYIGY